MPVSFLTEDQARRYGRFAGDPSPEQLARHFHLDDADHAFVAGHRGAHMRLGCAVQLGTVRFLGTFLEDPTDVPARVVRCLAEQLDLTVDGHMAAYRASGWRWRHPVEIREAYGYRARSTRACRQHDRAVEHDLYGCRARAAESRGLPRAGWGCSAPLPARLRPRQHARPLRLFSLPEALARGELRPLRDPSLADDDTGE